VFFRVASFLCSGTALRGTKGRGRVCLVGVVNFVPYFLSSGKTQNYCIAGSEDELRVAVTMLGAGR
jgi:hypothetical protein